MKLSVDVSNGKNLVRVEGVNSQEYWKQVDVFDLLESKGVNPIEFSPVREDGAFVIGESLEDIPDPVLEEITQSISGQLLEAEIYQ